MDDRRFFYATDEQAYERMFGKKRCQDCGCMDRLTVTVKDDADQWVECCVPCWHNRRAADSKEVA